MSDIEPAALAPDRGRLRHGLADLGRKVVDIDAAPLRDRDGAFHDVRQFSHVSGPRVPQKAIRRRSG